MDKVTFNVDPQKPIKFGNTTINGGSVITDLASFAKYNSEKNTSSGESGVTADTSGTQKSKSGGSSSAVAARDYVSGNGFSGITDWDGENVTVGGYVIVPEYVKDGTAYVSRDAVDSAIEKVKKANGISSAEDIRDTVSGKYGSYIDKTLKTLAGRGEFTYDPETDPAYSAYKEQYEREGDRAYRKILNDNNTSVTGASGAVLSEAMAARNLYMQEMTDMIPELEMNAYERYSGENDRLISTLNAVADMADNEYDRRYTASRDAYNNLISASAAENSEKQRWIENQRADEQNRIENERNANNDYYTNAQKAADTAKTAIP